MHPLLLMGLMHLLQMCFIDLLDVVDVLPTFIVHLRDLLM
jgi:hypothetical protein